MKTCDKCGKESLRVFVDRKNKRLCDKCRNKQKKFRRAWRYVWVEAMLLLCLSSAQMKYVWEHWTNDDAIIMILDESADEKIEIEIMKTILEKCGRIIIYDRNDMEQPQEVEEWDE